MGKKKKAPDCPKGAPLWMCTFSDMMSLLLAFFVMLLSFSSMDNRKVKEALTSLHGAFGVLEAEQHSRTDAPIKIVSVSRKPSNKTPKGKLTKTEIKQKERIIQQLVKKSQARDKIDVKVTEGGLHLKIDGDVLFNPGESQLRPGADAVLRELAEPIMLYPNPVEIQGHTDDTPIGAGSRYRSNEHLSFERAYSVMRFYITQVGVEPDRLYCSAFGATMPIADNATVQGRIKNRRVEMVLKAVDEDMTIYNTPLFKPPIPIGELDIEPY
jgi:chemotaxis protein MotB